jgi:hypothetical protein
MAADGSEQFVLLNHLADEFAARYRRGERPTLEEYVDHYPELGDDIRELFPPLAAMEQVKEDREAVSEPAAGPLPPLERLGDFRILREIGRGGMGVVYEAEQVSLGRHVALKVLPQKLLADARTRQRFEREAKAAARLHHTNIVPVFGVGEHDGLPFYAMQFIQGTGLDIVIEELARLGAGLKSADSPPAGAPAASRNLSAVSQALLKGAFGPAADPGDGAGNSSGTTSAGTDTSGANSSLNPPGRGEGSSGSKARKLT